MASTRPELIKPSDARAWSLCARRVWLDNKGDLELAPVEDDFEQLIIQLGLAHEQVIFEKLANKFEVRTAHSFENTRQLIAERVPVIYQAQLVDEAEGLVGYPDFLILNENGEYQAADAKLSLSAEKEEIKVQLGVYRKLLANQFPAIVFLGDGQQALIGEEADKVTNKFIREMQNLLRSTEQPPARYSHSKCTACPYYQHCRPAFEAKGELSLLYGINGRSVPALEQEGIRTITDLAASDPAQIPDVPYLKGEDKIERAVLQAQSYLSGEVIQRSPVTLPDGQWIHFDIEDNPVTENSGKHVYLWGFLVPEYGPANFEYVWTDGAEDDEAGWIEFLNQVERYRQQYPHLVLAHYSAHEVSTIRSYAERYNMQDHTTVKYLLGEESPLFDLQKPVLQSLVLPLQGYGLKDICKHPDLVNFQWEDDDSGSQWSVVQFNRYLLETDPQTRADLKAEILSYNRDDVTATRRLEEWLRDNFAP
ncbi:MAG: TM0106 family RecB-like putative nuclease [bacterium]